MRLAFEDVSYSYEGGEAKKRRGRRKKDAARQADWGNAPDAVWALRDVTFTVEPGEFFGVAGHTGSGKSTLAKRLGERYGLPVLHMDTVHFLPGWVERPFAEEEAMVRQFLDENAGGWVIDGNYSKTCYARRLKEADKIIVLWFSPLVCLWRAVRRWQQNKGRVRESSAPGCEEKIDAEFVRWILHDGRTAKKRAEIERIGEEYPEKYVMIRNQRELDGFLEFIKSKDSRAGGAD